MIMVQTFRTEQLDNLFHANTTQLHWENQNSALPIIAEVPTFAIGTKSSQVISHPSTKSSFANLVASFVQMNTSMQLKVERVTWMQRIGRHAFSGFGRGKPGDTNIHGFIFLSYL